MPEKQISITLPPHIDNIFNHGSGENDYLNNTFDDREMNLEDFYELNFQIYKNLLKEEKYEDEVFLEVKRNLYYLEESGFTSKEFSFKLSKFYEDKQFINNEIEKKETGFDKSYSSFFRKNFKKQEFDGFNIKNFLSSDTYSSIDFIVKLMGNSTGKECLKKLGFENKISDLILSGNKYMLYYLRSKLSTEEGIDILIRLNVKEEIKKISEDKDKDISGFLCNASSKLIGAKYIQTLELNSYIKKSLKENPDNIGSYLSNISHFEGSIEYIKSLSVEKKLVKCLTENEIILALLHFHFEKIL